MINRTNYVMENIQWKYFTNHLDEKKKHKLEKTYRTLTSTDQEATKGLRILLDVISRNPEMKADLGINPYNLYAIGLRSYINFKEPANLVAYKVDDFTQATTLFISQMASDQIEFSKEETQTKILETIHHNRNYLLNFFKGYMLIKLPNSLTNQDFNFEELTKQEGMKSFKYNKEHNTVIFLVK